MVRRLVVLVATIGALFTVACGSDGSSKPANVSLNVLDDLAPGTTLHTVEVHYQRHGPAEGILKLSDSYQPETLRTESWMTFGQDGKLTSGRSESKTKDGKLFASSHLDNDEVVYEGRSGAEERRVILGELTLEDVTARYRDALEKLRSDVAAHPDAPAKTVRGMKVVLIERSRHPWTFPLQDVSSGDFVSTYVYDLKPVEQVRRYYATPEGAYELRNEWVAIGADGTETVIESWDYPTTEVLTP